MTDACLQPLVLAVTPEAASRVLQVAEEQDEPARLRIAIAGGGCSGFKYAFTFDADVLEDDLEVATAGLTIVCDPLSALYLQGAELRYEENLTGAQLVLRNPNATHTCGCGQSFSA
jgi:iron-sulfur cluster insertion protein